MVMDKLLTCPLVIWWLLSEMTRPLPAGGNILD